jgi:hypothetical protein
MSGLTVDHKSLSVLTSARYGKDKIRVLRVVREGKWHHVVEYIVTALLEGVIAARHVLLLYRHVCFTGLLSLALQMQTIQSL